MKAFLKLRYEFDAADVSYQDLANKLGISPTSLSQRLCGHVQWELCECYAVMAAINAPLERFEELFPPQDTLKTPKGKSLAPIIQPSKPVRKIS